MHKHISLTRLPLVSLTITHEPASYHYLSALLITTLTSRVRFHQTKTFARSQSVESDGRCGRAEVVRLQRGDVFPHFQRLFLNHNRFR